MTPAPGNATNAVILERLDLVLTRLNALERKLDESERERATFRTDYERRHAELNAKTEATNQRITAHENLDFPRWEQVRKLAEEVELLKDQVTELRHANKIMSWIAGIVGSSLVVWFLGQLLGLI